MKRSAQLNVDDLICIWNVIWPPPIHAAVYASDLRAVRALQIAAQVVNQISQLLHITVQALLSGKQTGKVLLRFAA
jgi:hypothetical protein